MVACGCTVVHHPLLQEKIYFPLPHYYFLLRRDLIVHENHICATLFSQKSELWVLRHARVTVTLTLRVQFDVLFL